MMKKKKPGAMPKSAPKNPIIAASNSPKMPPGSKKPVKKMKVKAKY